MTTKSNFLRLPDCDIYYEVTGNGSPLIFAHGLGGNHLSWWQQIPFLSQKYTCIIFAHRGFYPSTGEPRVKEFANDLSMLIKHLKLNNVVLIGQSMGGWTYLEYALKHQEKVKALVMASTSGTFKHEGVDNIFDNEFNDTRKKLLEKGINPAAGERMAKEQPELHFLYKEINGLVHIDKEKIRQDLGSSCTRTKEDLKILTIPILCISGEEDLIISPKLVESFADVLPNAQYVKVPKAGHSVYFERAKMFNELVYNYLIKLL